MAHEVWTAAAAVCLIGFAEGVLFPATFNKAAEVVPRASLTAAISLLLSCIYTFQFLSPLFMKGIQLLFHFHSTREVFMLVACGLGLAAIAYLPLMRTRKTQEPQGPQAASHSRG
ncbi:MFS transporter [Paenibacillus sp. TAB 01]|uniref:MFS transporter n=1 Tax=Paenibacillus sp. TAB 01 TaxID=3368988 RepID=UPI003751134E